MASTRLAFVAVGVLLLQASWCAVSQQDAKMVWTRFHEGNGSAACDGKYHFDGAPLAALSTEWYAGRREPVLEGDLHHEQGHTGKTVRASVVDEVDGDNMGVAVTGYVWGELGFNDPRDYGEVAVTWAVE